MAFFNSSASTGPGAAAEKDIEMGDPPTDSISSMSFSGIADYLAVGSWDNSVRIYEVGAGGQSQGKAMYNHEVTSEGPVLSVCWNKEGNKVFSGGADNAGRITMPPIKVVKWIDTPQAQILATGSWDKTIKAYPFCMLYIAPSDFIFSTGTYARQLQSRLSSFRSAVIVRMTLAVDVQFPLMVVGTAERHIQIFNLSNPTTPYKTMVSPLKWQTRVVSCFTASTNSGFAVGSVEGRVAIQYVEDKDSGNNFSFKCHRRDSTPTSKDGAIVFAVNDISFHPVHGTFSTCGADGSIHFWDKDARNRLKSFEAAPGPISTTTFNRNGSIFAYAVSYDWSKGHSGMTPGHPNKLMLHACKDDEVKKRPRKV
ncbi:Poly + rna export protein [Mycena sanguinolenta]|uniref:Poly + rna export protein n=1 Tax=Mycena sanguinolenta TaxID=230812 RepID=A0A8H6ZCE7_9AGAR|nr:Poly + rna export protein [Mycena sanguinolenta]